MTEKKGLSKTTFVVALGILGAIEALIIYNLSGWVLIAFYVFSLVSLFIILFTVGEKVRGVKPVKAQSLPYDTLAPDLTPWSYGCSCGWCCDRSLGGIASGM